MIRGSITAQKRDAAMKALRAGSHTPASLAAAVHASVDSAWRWLREWSHLRRVSPVGTEAKPGRGLKATLWAWTNHQGQK